jgi:superfamily II DNA or RNA helicase
VTELRWTPGSLVRARGREWIVLTGSDAEVLRVRPLSGSEHDQTVIHTALEPVPVTDATFPAPEVWHQASHDAAQLLRDALLLSLRRGAGPFRSFGQLAVEPRAYQLVPLLMALKLDPVRLLIADDVGIGKTIEAALIARELLDRGEVRRFTVLCPPHLVDQWVTELEDRFHLHPVAITAGSAKTLESRLPQSESIFTTHAHTVVSLDYIKSDVRRDRFLRDCPELVIVDEAHTCAATGAGRHQRYALLKGLVADGTRHLVMLTATPHSGDEDAYFRLLGLLHPDFATLATATGDQHKKLRERLAAHFVQRRRLDIADWEKASLFPQREPSELTYRLTGAWARFFDATLAYCEAVVAAAGQDQARQRLSFWAMLALMRCVASSPAAASAALRHRAGQATAGEGDELADQVFDGSGEGLPDDDVEPPAATDDPTLAALIEQAEGLRGHAGDPKLRALTEHVASLTAAGFQPVVFCRYLSTAHYVGEHLASSVAAATVAVVTGEQPSEQRKLAVDALASAERRILVATDCLSEGVNLQDLFDAVVHYDLSWNPTRHEQREGRVDRFGQKQPVVRTTLLYGADNPVDGAVLEVILRKADQIREELGVPVPLPDHGHTLTQALMKAVFLRKRERDGKRQQALPFAANELPEAKAIDARWQEAKAKINRTVFAQRRLKPEEVLPEWRKALAALGDQDDVQRFTARALARFDAALEPLGKRGWKTPLAALPEELRERLAAHGLAGTVRVDFNYPPAAGCHPIGRSHPLVAVLAEGLLESTLTATRETRDPASLGRVGCWVASGVTTRTIVVLLRLRHQLTARRATLLVEEAHAVAWTPQPIEGPDALALLSPPPVGDPPAHVRDRAIAAALDQLPGLGGAIEAAAERRAQELLADHRRVREAADARGSYGVKALLPVDVIGLYVLLPRVG